MRDFDRITTKGR